MTTFNENTRKDHLKQRIDTALQRVELLKKKDGCIALMKPDPLRRPRLGRAGISTFDATLWTLIAIGVLISVLSLYTGVVDSLRTAALRSQLTRAVAIIERDHTYSGIYVGANLVNFLKNEGFTTKELRKDGDNYEFFSPYGTPITIAANPLSGSRRFVVTMEKLPPSGCEAAAMTFANTNAGLDELKIGDEVIQVITEGKVLEECAGDETKVTLKF